MLSLALYTDYVMIILMGFNIIVLGLSYYTKISISEMVPECLFDAIFPLKNCFKKFLNMLLLKTFGSKHRS